MATGGGKSVGTSKIPAASSEVAADIKMMGYLRKLKTGKKKYFVMRGESESGVPRLEYYDTEKKFRTGCPPKRSMSLRTCFNINRNLDTKHKFVVALYTKDDCFSVILDKEEDMDAWLNVMLELQQGREFVSTEKPKPIFEHVWQVGIRNKGLGSSRNIFGNYRLCLTPKTLTLHRNPPDGSQPIEFPLISIRRCGNTDNFFFMELGRNAITGSGELWMSVEDSLIAMHMHEAILQAMKMCNQGESGAWFRLRSYSNDTTKPIGTQPCRGSTAGSSGSSSSRGRADSVPTRPRTLAGGDPESTAGGSGMPGNPPVEQQRSRSIHSDRLSCSPPCGSPIESHAGSLSTAGGDSFDESDMDRPSDISYGRYGHSLTEDIPFQPPIAEEFESQGYDSYMAMAPMDYESQKDTKNVEYMEMNPSSHQELTVTIPPFSTPSAVVSPTSVTYHTQTSTSFNSPPSFLSIGAASTDVRALHPASAQSAPNESDYLEMASPGGNSSTTADAPGGYMPMSPVGSVYSASALTRTRSVSSHTISPEPFPSVRSPILTPDTPKDLVQDRPGNGYVPMGPVKDSIQSTARRRQSPPEDEGYMDMTPVSQSLSATTSGELKPEPSLSRRSSGTPSNDLCFTEYPLDKVRSYFAPSEDDEPIMVRAYSIGSRTECGGQAGKTTSRLEAVGAAEASRTRAFSVGSKRAGNKVGSKLNSGTTVTTPTSATAVSSRMTAEERNKKSSSAPLLGTSPFGSSWSTAGASFLHKGPGGRSASRNEDLMEMAFPESYGGGGSSNGRPRTNSRSSHGRPAKMDTQLQSIGERTNSISGAALTTSAGDGNARVASVVHPGDYADMSAMSSSTKVASFLGKSDSSDRRGHSRGGGNKRSSQTGGSDGGLGGRKDSGASAIRPVSRLSAQLSGSDYVDMNMSRRESETSTTVVWKDSATLSPGNRPTSSPVKIVEQIATDAPSSSKPGSSPGSGEYVNIDPSVRHLSRSPAPFDTVPPPAVVASGQQRKAWNLSGVTKSSDTAPSTLTTRRTPSVSSPEGPIVTSSPAPAKSDSLAAEAARHNPEYVNLQFGRLETNHRASPAAISSPIPVGGGRGVARMGNGAEGSWSDGSSLTPGRHQASSMVESDYALMSPQSVAPLGTGDRNAMVSLPATALSVPGEAAVPGGATRPAVVSKPAAVVAPTASVTTSGAPAASVTTCGTGGGAAKTVEPTSVTVSASLAVAAESLVTNSSSSSSELSAADGPSGSDVSEGAVFVEGDAGGVQQQRSSRPPSVSNERQPNYVSLDLAPSAVLPETKTNEGTDSSSPAALPLTAYAEIDFSKSEGLRVATATALRQVRP